MSKKGWDFKGCDSNFEVILIETVIENRVRWLVIIVIIVFKRFPSTGTYCLMQGRCFICRDF